MRRKEEEKPSQRIALSNEKYLISIFFVFHRLIIPHHANRIEFPHQRKQREGFSTTSFGKWKNCSHPPDTRASFGDAKVRLFASGETRREQTNAPPSRRAQSQTHETFILNFPPLKTNKISLYLDERKTRTAKHPGNNRRCWNWVFMASNLIYVRESLCRVRVLLPSAPKAADSLFELNREECGFDWSKVSSEEKLASRFPPCHPTIDRNVIKLNENRRKRKFHVQTSGFRDLNFPTFISLWLPPHSKICFHGNHSDVLDKLQRSRTSEKREFDIKRSRNARSRIRQMEISPSKSTNEQRLEHWRAQHEEN